MNEVYVIAGGEWLRNNLNAIAAFMGTWTWDSIEKIALTLSVLAVAVMWVQRHNVMDLLGWVANVTQHNGEWKTLSSDKVGNILFAFAVAAQVLTWCETRSGWRTAAAILMMALWGPLSGTSYGIAGLLMLAVSHRLYPGRVTGRRGAAEYPALA